jgi:hypothetical protein
LEYRSLSTQQLGAIYKMEPNLPVKEAELIREIAAERWAQGDAAAEEVLLDADARLK